MELKSEVWLLQIRSPRGFRSTKRRKTAAVRSADEGCSRVGKGPHFINGICMVGCKELGRK